MRTVLAILVVLIIAIGCSRNPEQANSALPTQKHQPTQDIAARFVATASDVQVFASGPTQRGDGSVGYFMLYVKEFEDTRIRLPWNTQVSEEEMKKVIQAMDSAGFFNIPEKPAPDRKNWRFEVYGPPGRVERYCTKQEFDTIVKAVSDVLPNGFKMKDR